MKASHEAIAKRAREEERAAVVEWLRHNAANGPDEWLSAYQSAADAIQRGDHDYPEIERLTLGLVTDSLHRCGKCNRVIPLSNIAVGETWTCCDGGAQVSKTKGIIVGQFEEGPAAPPC